MNTSFCVGRSAPPDSTSEITGSRFCVVGAEAFLQGPRVAGATAHRRIVGDDEAFDAADHTDAHDGARPDGEVAAPGRERTQLEEGGVLVDEQFDAFASEQFSAFLVPLYVFLTAAEKRLGVLGVDLGEFGVHDLGRTGELLGCGVEGGLEHAHA